MAPPEYYIRFQRGIKGGFIAPRPSEIIQVTHSAETPSIVTVGVEKREGNDLAAAPSKEVAPSKVAGLVEELESILKNLPTEEPRGTEDIYGLNIGITYGSPNLEWANQSSTGCDGGKSSVQATAEQKVQFKRAVEIVEQLGNTV